MKAALSGSTGGSIAAGLVQAALTADTVSAIVFGSVVLIPCGEVWIDLTWIYGGRLERR